MAFKENKFRRSRRIEGNMLSRKIISEKDNLFLLKSYVFSVCGLLLAILVLKHFLHLKYKESFRLRKS